MSLQVMLILPCKDPIGLYITNVLSICAGIIVALGFLYVQGNGQIIQRAIHVFSEINCTLTVLIFFYALHNLNIFRPTLEKLTFQ